MSATRSERDSLGTVEVPADAYYGAQTQRARENFPISGDRMPRRFIEALGLIKAAAAAAHRESGAIPREKADAIERAAREVMRGERDADFVVDVFQTGSGTSTNMNANEVIANRASELLGHARGSMHVHPNDDVNRAQSSNDVIPSALHVAARLAIERDLVPALDVLAGAIERKARAFEGVVKLGRTHLQDATPMTVGQEFGGWAAQVRAGIARARRASEGLRELALGGTAVGTGLNAPPGFAARVIASISAETALDFAEARDHFEAQGARDAALEASGALKTIAASLAKIAEDVRLLASGPRAGLGELRLPSLQPGSSIMPGKVNPVLCESVTQVAAQVIGNDAAITVGAIRGQLELNVFIPMIAHNLLESIRLLAAVAVLFAQRCIDGIELDRGAVARGRRAQPRDGHRARAADRLRPRGRAREGGVAERPHGARGRGGAGRAVARRARRGARPAAPGAPAR